IKMPIHGLGSGHALLWFHHALRPYRSIRPAVDFVYLTYCVRLNPFCDLPTPIERVPLVSHLGSYFMLFCKVGKKAGFIDRVGEWLLRIAMLSQSDGMRCHAGMGMVRSCHHHSIDGCTHLVEHFSPVFKPLGFGVIIKCFLRIAPVHIT